MRKGKRYKTTKVREQVIASLVSAVIFTCLAEGWSSVCWSVDSVLWETRSLSGSWLHPVVLQGELGEWQEGHRKSELAPRSAAGTSLQSTGRWSWRVSSDMETCTSHKLMGKTFRFSGQVKEISAPCTLLAPAWWSPKLVRSKIPRTRKFSHPQNWCFLSSLQSCRLFHTLWVHCVSRTVKGTSTKWVAGSNPFYFLFL
jgi:hypothetical protein